MPGSSRRGVFLSYRRDDAGPYARSLQLQLSQRIPDAPIFMDLDSIEPGLDFAEVIEQAVNSSAVLVALIGRQWAVLTDEDGDRRLNNPNDYVRFEVKTALEQGLRVIPVLIDGAKPLRQQDLPAELHKLARLNAHKLSYDRYQDDADRLLGLIQRVLAAISDQQEADRKAQEEEERKAQEEERKAQEEEERKAQEEEEEEQRKAQEEEQRKASVEEAEQKDEFDVILLAAGDKKIQVIKEVRSLTGLGLKEAKDLVDGAPKPLLERVSKETADRARAALEGAGATVTVKRDEFDVILLAAGDNKIQVIKEVRTFTGLGLKEAKDLVDGAPKPLLERVSKETADRARAALEGAGATVTVKRDEFDVILLAAGDKRIQVIKEVRSLTGLGLKEAKDLVDGAPKPLLERVSKETADRARAALEEAGATVTVN